MTRRIVTGALLVWCIILFLFGVFVTPAGADTILFPVFVSNPGIISTIISVTNIGASFSWLNTHLTYTYVSKSATSSYSDECGMNEKTINTYGGDLVTFDASGTIGSGQALFNDPDSYTRTFNIPLTDARRGYLLVSNTNSSGTRVNVGSNSSLRGEAIIMDIVSGSAWGYKAVNDTAREDYSFRHHLEGGGLYSIQVSGVQYASRFSFNPLSSWTTKFFITPLISDMNIFYNGSSVIRLYEPVTLTSGIRGRGTNTYSFDVPVTVKCHAAVNITDLLDSTAQAALASTGGWGLLNIESGDYAVIYKLEYTFSSPFVPLKASNNNGIFLSGID
jgi:hypothetical protein